MEIIAKINLDEVWVGGEWETAVAEIVRDELRSEIRRELKAAVKSDPKLKKAVRRLQQLAAEQILAAVG